MAEIEAVRLRAGVSQGALVRAAGLSESQYRRYLRGRCEVAASVARRLVAALARLARSSSPASMPETGLLAAYSGFLMHAAGFYGLTAPETRFLLQGEERTGDPRWLAAARARQAAIYLTITAVGTSQHRVAKALALTPSAVCQALRAVEDRRDEEAFDAMIIEAEMNVGAML